MNNSENSSGRLIISGVIGLLIAILLAVVGWSVWTSQNDSAGLEHDQTESDEAAVVQLDPTATITAEPAQTAVPTPIPTETEAPVATETPEPTPTAEEPENPSVDLLADPSLWRFDGANASAAIFEDDALALRSQAENYYFFSYYRGEIFGAGEYTFDVAHARGTQGDGEIVISFLSDIPQQTSYLMFIDTRGAFLVQHCRDLCASADGITFLTDGWQQAPALNFEDGEPRRMKIVVDESLIQIFVDDSMIFETADVRTLIGAFGLGLFQYSGENLTEIRFSDLRFTSRDAQIEDDL